MLVILGLALNAWGIVSNGVVVMANGGTMPVVVGETSEHILHIIAENMGGYQHSVTSQGQLLFLADIFRINFHDVTPYVPNGIFGRAVMWWSKWLDFPIDGGLNFVSIGDLMRWIGSANFLLGTLLVTTVLIPRRLLTGDLPRVFKQ